MQKGEKQLQSFGLVSKNERLLLELLEGGPRQHSEIIKLLDKKAVKKRTANNLLKECCGSGKIFRIERKDGKVFYKLNDFPPNVKVFLVILDNAIKEKKLALLGDVSKEEDPIVRAFYEYINQTPTDKQELVVYQTLKANIIRLYPKRDIRQICQFTIAEIYASASCNQSLLNFLEGLKAALD